MCSLIYRFFISALLLAHLNGSLEAQESSSKQTVNIGIISFRPITENQEYWKPLKTQLEHFSPEYNFNVTSLKQVDLARAIAHGELDFAIVHPSAFIEMETKYGVVNIASIVKRVPESGKYLSTYGGVIATLSTTQGIKELRDAKGKTIATTHKDAFAAMLAQQAVFSEAGVDILQECQVIYTGQPMDLVLEALRSKKAEIGFFRTGYIEEMVAKGKLSKDELTVLNRQNIQDYPYLLSTPLYPEWAVVSTTKPNPQTVKKVVSALYQIKSTNTPDYYEFGIPLSYKTTRELMQHYQIYPYNAATFNLKDFIKKYNLQIILFFTLFAAIGILLAVRYFFLMRKSQKQSRQIETILSTSSDGIHIHDEGGRLVLFSDSFASMLGYNKEEMSKMTVFDWDKHFKPEKIRAMMKGLRGQAVRLETKHTKKDGTSIDVEIHARGMVINGENLIFSSSRDITEQLANKKTLLEHQAMLENLAEGVYAVNTKGICTYVNGMACELLGLSKDDIIGSNTHRLFHQKHRDGSIYHTYECPVHIAASMGATYEGEEWLVKSSGEFINVHISAAPVFENSKLIGSVVSFRDISRQKELYAKLESSERSLKELNESLEEKIKEELAKNRQKDMLIIKQSRLAAIGELLGNIAHQWRQPLNAIAIIIQDIKSAYKFGDLNEAYIDKTVQTSMTQINYMSKIIDELSGFFIPEEEKSIFCAKTAIENSVKIASASISNLNIKLELNIDVDAKLLGQEYEFGQALLNIVNNAKDAISKANIENGKISISTAIEPQNYTISIKNNGPQIDESILGSIFDPYFTTKYAAQGTGLGLYMTKITIEQNMGGSVDAKNIDGGVEFVISVPFQSV